MEQNLIFDIMINLLKGIKNQNKLVTGELVLSECSYLLNQVIRQYQIPQSHYFVSKSAQDLWNKISSDSIFNYTYRDTVTKDIDGTICIEKFRGGEGSPHETATIRKGDKFIYKDVFSDEHIVTVSNIIEELCLLPEYNYDSIKTVLDKIYICKMLKSEDRSIKSKRNRSTDYREVIVHDYQEAGIYLTTFNYIDELRKMITEYDIDVTTLIKEISKKPMDNPIAENNVKKETTSKNDCLFEVIHDKKGDGKAIAIVTKEDDRYIRIEFENSTEDFVYPDQFFFHLKAKDRKIQEQIEQEYVSAKNTVSTENFLLTVGYEAGTKAINIYDKYCSLFGWKTIYRGKFSMHHILYARNATPEGYSVGMVTNSNLNKPFNRSISWYNVFEGDMIKEFWFNPEEISRAQDYPEIRVCFAKVKNGSYAFEGCYRYEKTTWQKAPDGKTEMVKIYQRISTVYPAPKKEEATMPPSITAEAPACNYVEVKMVLEGSKLEVLNIDDNQKSTVYVDQLLPIFRKKLIGKSVGDRYSLSGKTFQINKIFITE